MPSGHHLRKEQHKKAKIKLEAKALALINQFITPEKLANEGDKEVFKQLDNLLQQNFNTKNKHRLARKALLKWVIQYNKTHDKTIIEPMIPLLVERDKLMIDYDWFVYGTQVSQAFNMMLDLWQRKRLFSVDDCIQGFLYTSIMLGGLNDTEALQALYQWLLHDRKIYYTQVPTSNGVNTDVAQQYRMIIPLAVESGVYGSRVAQNKNQIVRYVTYLPDDISLCFLYALKDKDLSKRKVVHFNTHIQQLSRTLKLTNKKPEQPYLSHLIRYANFHWQQLTGSLVSPATVNVMMGRHRTTAISTNKLLNYNQEALKTEGDINVTLTALFKSIQQTPTNNALPPLAYPEFSRNLLRELQEALKLSRNKAIETIQLIRQQYPQDNANRLIAWVLSMLGQKKQSLNNKSISLYIGVIGRQWLTLTMHEDLSIWTAQDYEEVYEEIIFSKLDDGRRIKSLAKADDSEDFDVDLMPEDLDILDEEEEFEQENQSEEETTKSRENQAYTSGRIKAFHDFQRKSFNAPKIEFNWIKNKYIVKDNIISPKIYHAMLARLSRANLAPDDLQLCQSTIILAYRLGLRINELAGLQVADCDGKTANWVWLRANRYRRLKSSSARRKFPANALLKPNEFSIFEQFVARKKRLRHQYLFSIGDGSQPLPLAFFSNLATILWDSLLDQHDFSFHSFRHTAISQIALLLNTQPALAGLMTDYTAEECDTIKTALLGENQGQSHWFGLASFAGHIDPEMTFKHYIHTAYIVAGLQQQQVQLDLPLLLLEKLTGISYAQSYRIHPNFYDKHKKTVNLSLFRQYFAKQLCDETARILPNLEQSVTCQSVSTTEQPTVEQLDKEEKIANSSLLHYQFDDIIAFLQELQEIDLESRDAQRDIIALRHGISQEVAIKILANIQNFQFFENNDLILTQPRGQQSQTQVIELLEKAKIMALEQPEKLSRFIEIFAKKVAVSISTIRFGNKDSEMAMMKEFLTIGTELLPAKHWQIRASTKNKANKVIQQLELSDNILTEKQTSYHGYQVNIVVETQKHSEKNPAKGAKYYKSYGVLKFCGCLLVALKSNELP